MPSELEDILEDRVGNLAPTVIEREKRKMGLAGEEIPDNMKEDFIQGLIFVCQSEVKIDIGESLKKELEHTLD